MSNKHIVLIGAGVMSATLATLIKKLEPTWHITILERASMPGKESSNVMNNAGTGHEALCELNYTPEEADGTINISKAVEIYNQFQVSKQLWSHLVECGDISKPGEFVQSLPHISFVIGEKNVQYLLKRYEKLQSLPAFKQMKFSKDAEEIEVWSPLIMKERNINDEVFAATKVDGGTDVNFGVLAKKMIDALEKDSHVTINYNTDVTALKQANNHTWEVKAKNNTLGTIESYVADFLFIGAGGNAIPLLQKTDIPQSKNLGGFPISGQFLYCENPEVVKAHNAKAYGKEPEGTPPMTVPHLDRRYVDGKEVLLFGPFAAFGPKFLKYGSNLDFFKHLKANNLLTMAAAGIKNIPLMKYSIEQVLMTKEDKLNELRRFAPSAQSNDWDVIVAGKRVQLIKDMSKSNRGVIQFGTEVVNSDDHTLSALLGESPGASTSASVALEVLQDNFAKEYNDKWQDKLKEMIPSLGININNDVELLEAVREKTGKYLELN